MSLDQLYRLHIPYVIAFLVVVVAFVLAGPGGRPGRRDSGGRGPR